MAHNIKLTESPLTGNIKELKTHHIFYHKLKWEEQTQSNNLHPQRVALFIYKLVAEIAYKSKSLSPWLIFSNDLKVENIKPKSRGWAEQRANG